MKVCFYISLAFPPFHSWAGFCRCSLFLQVTRLVILLPSFYSYRQIIWRTISQPDPIGGTATPDTDLEFILKCLSHRPPFQYARGEVETERGRQRGERVRRSTAVQINECTIGGWVSSPLPVWPTACTNCVWGGTTCMQSTHTHMRSIYL